MADSNKGGRGCKVDAKKRADEFPDDLILMGENILMCKFCNTNISTKIGVIKKHIDGKEHKKLKDEYARKRTKPFL